MTAHETLELKTSWGGWVKKQWEFFKWEPSASNLSIEAMLGSWGFGKTTGAGRKFLKRALQNPWTPKYGDDCPKAVIAAPTHRILTEVTVPKFLANVPQELIRKRKDSFPSPFIQLINGLKIFLVSADAELEGFDLCLFWTDEIHHPFFASHPAQYLNYVARLRDPNAPIMSMIVSGLPTAGWVRDRFDRDPHDQRGVTILGAMRDNPFLPEATREQLLLACPAGSEGLYVNGQWGLPIGATFPMYDSTIHLSRDRGEPQVPVHLGIDVGQHGAILAAQMVPVRVRGITGHETTAQAMLIVDQILTEAAGVDEALTRFRTETRWEVIRGRSKICVDPTIRKDELNAIRKHFPGVQIVIRQRADQYYDVENGLEHVRLCLRDTFGNARIRFWDGLARTRYGVVDSIQAAKGNPHTGKLYLKDDSHDHVICALRYLATELLANPREGPKVVG